MRTIKLAYIYALVDPVINQVRYVGKADNPKKRFRQHLRERDATYKSRWVAKLTSMALKPKLLILEETEQSAWKEREKFWIAYFQDLGMNLVNLTDGGDGTIGYCHTEKAKEKMSVNRRGILAWNKGIPMREESKQKLRESHLGKKNSAVSKANAARIITGRTRERLRQRPQVGVKKGIHLKHLREGLKRYWASLSFEEKAKRIDAVKNGKRQKAREAKLQQWKKYGIVQLSLNMR